MHLIFRTLIFIFMATFLAARQPPEAVINLDLHPTLRYQAIAHEKRHEITRFLDYLHTVTKYKYAFSVAHKLSPFLKWFVGDQFYDECYSISSSIDRPVSEIVVFNYMYELGSFKDFCTSIPVNYQNNYYLARNLDYGYQQYLAQNSMIFDYQSGGKTLFKTVGHVGLIGTHTVLRYDGYSATLNERIHQNFFQTMFQIFVKRSQTVPYLLMKTARQAETIEEAEYFLSQSRTVSGVYYILNGKGKNVVIEKSRKQADLIYQNQDIFVQTNTDRSKPDPDGRRTVAEEKVEQLKRENNLNEENIWKILTEQPNKNKLTLMTMLLHTAKNQIAVEVWDQ